MGRYAIITDTHVTPANVHDSVPYLGRLDRQRERLFGAFAIHPRELRRQVFPRSIGQEAVARGGELTEADRALGSKPLDDRNRIPGDVTVLNVE